MREAAGENCPAHRPVLQVICKVSLTKDQLATLTVLSPGASYRGDGGLLRLGLQALAKRILIVTPANLAFQWQRELKEKFDEKFIVILGSDLRIQFGVNPWLAHRHLVTSLDLAKRDEILSRLRRSQWDLVIVDEARRMSAAAEDKKSLRDKLGELLREITEHYLLLMATPHKGDPRRPEPFASVSRLFAPL